MRRRLGGRFDYDSLGNAIGGDGPSEGDLFAGREFDAETALQYNRLRCYDPTPGRWIDYVPIGFHAGEEGLYRYPDTDPAPPASDGHA